MTLPEEAGMPETHDHEPASSWVSREVEAMITAWERGAEVTAQDVLDRRAEIDAESAIRLIYEETCLRREAGQQRRNGRGRRPLPALGSRAGRPCSSAIA